MFWYKRNTQKEKEVWHKWFAWYPITVSKTVDGDSKKLWLVDVLRCGVYECWCECYWSWEYEEITEG